MHKIIYFLRDSKLAPNLHQIGVQSQKAVQKHNLKIRVETEFASLQCTWQKPLRAKNSNHTAYKIRRTMQTMRR